MLEAIIGRVWTLSTSVDALGLSERPCMAYCNCKFSSLLPFISPPPPRQNASRVPLLCSRQALSFLEGWQPTCIFHKHWVYECERLLALADNVELSQAPEDELHQPFIPSWRQLKRGGGGFHGVRREGPSPSLSVSRLSVYPQVSFLRILFSICSRDRGRLISTPPLLSQNI
ncbi:hypothetical protein P168DRAFT_129919 [Aspergillus campestris IBT 28561]|uniref:Uncharacterized protein n=1 Tax=Aspergillus campestris (strain IBT 28561) TaxID=1392248 RepID=A0A2I1D778_ASPC2|nr:uncharacterized protein P168DRAFT_129919 [Aspergillus campestris IBT 28561]PKY05728.1 hypothetical protein P168DRAFT_129919 [Aspergillus campestris IBT 28561]